MVNKMAGIWVFVGSNAKFPSGIFSEKEYAQDWIKKYNLSGVLTLYPLDQGIYDWAINNNTFSVKKESEMTPEFIQRFTSAAQEHYHFENGELD